MLENNKGQNNQDDNDLDSSINDDSKQGKDTVVVQGTTFTREEVEEANKPQPNVILDKVSGPNTGTTRDNERVNPRANEAPDSTDSNTGGIISGGAKGANQS